MSRVSLEFTGLPEFKMAMNQVEELLEKDIKKTEAKEARQNLKPKIRSAAPRVSGKLWSSVRTIITDDFVGVIVDVPYAVAVHYGRRKSGFGRGMHAIKRNPWVDKITKARRIPFKESMRTTLDRFEKKATRKVNR